MATTEQAATGSTEFHVTVITATGASFVSIERHTDAVAALQAAIAQEGDPNARIEVRPLVEVTFGQGASRYPHALNVRASAEAHAGWKHAAERDVAERNRVARAHADHQALQLQANRQDHATQAATGGLQ